jgi:hypothetical protein
VRIIPDVISLGYHFLEHAMQGWGEFLWPAGEGMSERRRHDAFRARAMAPFFGASTFRLG